MTANHAARGINRDPRGFAGSAHTQIDPDLVSSPAPSIQPGAKGEFVMAKGQMRSNKEKKKPKADKNLKKGGSAAQPPFTSGKPPPPYPNNKKG
jgi:hypothetical protein